MNAPGESLLIRLWETLTEKGIGALLTPWQTRRVGRAKTDVRAEAALVLAQAERNAEEIRAGRLRLGPGGQLEPVAPEVVLGTVESVPAAPAIEAPPSFPMLQAATGAIVADHLRKEVNVARAVLHAEDELTNEAEEAPKENPSADWLYRWRDAAAEVSTEELQHLWGQVLAGEVKTPGAFSLRTLEFLRHVTHGEARMIQIAARFVVDQKIPRDMLPYLQGQGLTFADLFRLGELGILTGLDSIGLMYTKTSGDEAGFKALMRSNDLGLVLEGPNPKSRLDLNIIAVTTLGRELMQLGNPKADRQYLTCLAELISQKGFKVSIGRVVRKEGTQVLLDGIEVLAENGQLTK